MIRTWAWSVVFVKTGYNNVTTNPHLGWVRGENMNEAEATGEAYRRAFAAKGEQAFVEGWTVSDVMVIEIPVEEP